MNTTVQCRRDADRLLSKTIIGIRAKLLANSSYGKLCEQKSRFRQVLCLKGRALDLAVQSPRYWDMSPMFNHDQCAMPIASTMRESSVAPPEDMEMVEPEPEEEKEEEEAESPADERFQEVTIRSN